jgi:hypothetical protein
LLGDKAARLQEWAALPSLSDEVERLRDLLRRHGIDPQDGVAWPRSKRLAELAAFFGQLKGLAFAFVEAFGFGPVNVSADDAVKGRRGVPGTRAGAGLGGVHDRDACVGLACGFVGFGACLAAITITVICKLVAAPALLLAIAALAAFASVLIAGTIISFRRDAATRSHQEGEHDPARRR